MPKKDFERRKAFVEAFINGKSSQAIIENLGIGTATYYKWRAAWLEFGAQWLTEQSNGVARRHRAQSQESAGEQIVQLSLGNPEWGAARVARMAREHLGVQVSTGSVHAILKRRGLSTLLDRAVALQSAYYSGQQLTGNQKRVVAQIDLYAAWGRSKPAKPGQTLIQQRIQIPYSSPIGKTVLLIIVDAYDQRAFGEFPTARRSENVERDFLQKVVDWYRSRTLSVSEVVTNNGYQYFDSYYGDIYENYLRQEQIRHRFDTSSTCGLRLNPLVKEVWADLRTHLFKEKREEAIAAANAGDWARLTTIVDEFLARTYGDGAGLFTLAERSGMAA